MRRSEVLHFLCVCMVLVSCANPAREQRAWSGYDYASTPKAKPVNRDFDADYSLPSTGSCMDDSPGCY